MDSEYKLSCSGNHCAQMPGRKLCKIFVLRQEHKPPPSPDAYKQSPPGKMEITLWSLYFVPIVSLLLGAGLDPEPQTLNLIMELYRLKANIDFISPNILCDRHITLVSISCSHRPSIGFSILHVLYTPMSPYRTLCSPYKPQIR